VNIADLVVDTLNHQGFALEDATYNKVDMRQAYSAKLRNYEGAEVIVYVVPTGEGLGENQLHLESLDTARRTEHELHQRWQEISSGLQSVGLDVGRLRVPARQPANRAVPQVRESKRRVASRPEA
jgi:hypothetical protein